MKKYYGTFTQDSVWYWASAGKTLTGFTVGIAQQEGLLSINDQSSQYLGNGWTSCPAAKEALITVKNQLAMTSGLDDDVADPHCTIDTCLQYLADAGTRWAYHNGPYTRLDGVIEAATGQSLNAYITQKNQNSDRHDRRILPVWLQQCICEQASQHGKIWLVDAQQRKLETAIKFWQTVIIFSK